MLARLKLQRFRPTVAFFSPPEAVLPSPTGTRRQHSPSCTKPRGKKKRFSTSKLCKEGWAGVCAHEASSTETDRCRRWDCSRDTACGIRSVHIHLVRTPNGSRGSILYYSSYFFSAQEGLLLNKGGRYSKKRLAPPWRGFEQPFDFLNLLKRGEDTGSILCCTKYL